MVCFAESRKLVMKDKLVAIFCPNLILLLFMVAGNGMYRTAVSSCHSNSWLAVRVRVGKYFH